jgi:hypothetical protein
VARVLLIIAASMIALTALFGFLLIGSIFMLVELHKAPYGVEDENGFTVVGQEGSAQPHRRSAKARRVSMQHIADSHHVPFPSHAR